MHLALYKALTSINITDDAATAVVTAMEAHIDSRVSQATQPILDKLDYKFAALDAKFAGLDPKFAGMEGILSAKIDAISQVKAETERAREQRSSLVRWVVGTFIAGVAATLGIARAFGLL